MDDVPVSDVMTDPVLTVDPGDRLDAVAGAMLEMGIKSVVVVDDACRPAGVLTSTDVVRAFADGADGATVEAYMTADVYTAAPDDSLAAVAALMTEEGIAHLPVVDGGSVVGILTTTDLAARLAARSEGGEIGTDTGAAN